ncbi:hypothetical protein HF288_09845 [Acidithiobacillus caldus]|uniref:hypothetical protein n=1 Tax=Acidithiobacillus caldus TaxID=33059 RepID=UPI001C07AA9A|nr:hypothetical protein [Acidithiobacillus caldus]MBU2821618.1 hypothetical protein [Acidithiobacillus caldus]
MSLDGSAETTETAAEEGLPPLRPDAVIVEAQTKRGKVCRLVDNTATVAVTELEELLRELIAQDLFQPLGLSSAGGSSIRIGAPQGGHIQLGESLYRLIVIDHEARLEPF